MSTIVLKRPVFTFYLVKKYFRGSISSIKTDVHYFRKIQTTSQMEDNEEKQKLLEKVKLFDWLGEKSPCFPVRGEQVHVIHEPSEFYLTLIRKIKQSRIRITLASLYLGTGDLEKELVSSIENVLKENNGEAPRVRILLDATRGTRGVNNSCTMLSPLVQSYNESCSIHLYHTPVLRGLLKSAMPGRLNEIIGLQHMKVYLFDDSILISGANLSNDYFTNRQDRYVLIENCKDLADFYDKLIETTCQFSFQMSSDTSLHLNPKWNIHPCEEAAESFAYEARKRIQNLFNSELAKKEENLYFNWPNPKSADTWIFPLIQMGQLGIFMDNIYTKQILECIPSSAEVSLATGYFNLTQDYMDSILYTSPANVHILMAHPSANGFLGAGGFAGAIPSAYTHIASQFFQQVISTGQSMRIRLWEYQRQLWTFHAKGLWISFSGNDPRPCFTLVGSPNFGYRSVYRDLETQLAIVTVNSSLRDKLHQERKSLFQHGDSVTGTTFTHPQRHVPLWVRFVIRVIKQFF